MKLGISSYAFRWSVGTKDFIPPVPVTPVSLLEKSVACGAEVVQICENVPLEKLSKPELNRIKQKAADFGLALEVGVKGDDLGHLQHNLEVCDQVGSKLMRVVLDNGEPVERIIQTIRTLTEQMKALDVKLAIENHFRFTPTDLVEIVEAVDDSRVGICLDPLNSISHLIGPAEVISTLAPYALSVHAKDAVAVRRGTGFYIAGCPLGQGMVNLRWMITTLREHKRSPNILVECWMDQRENPEMSITQEEDWVRHGITYLRGIL